MIPSIRYWFLLLLLCIVYATGIFVPLMENDSAQFAVMAMRMVQENDFLHLFKGPEPYLDKPHMHFWLAALSYQIFGIQDWAYRIPGILSIFLGAYSCYGLGTLLYNKQVGKLASLIFLSAQTIVLAAIDVRTDAVLTGFTILAIWQIAVFIEKNSTRHLLIGAFAAGMAFATKGQIALLVIGLPLLCHLTYTRKWRVLLRVHWLLAALIFLLTISPVLYAYYVQFDLHPEVIIRGRNHRSGLLFIFWEQSFERLSGEGIGKNSSDYFFFFHTFLWVLLPWTIVGILSYWTKVRTFVKLHFTFNSKYEFLTLGGVTLIFAIISFAQFKLPHYLNIIIPLFALLTASYLYNLNRFGRSKVLKRILVVQFGILFLYAIVSALICFVVFNSENPLNYIWKVLLFITILYFSLKRGTAYVRILTVAVCSSVLLNAVLNLHFYPSLLKYQAGSSMSEIVAREGIPVDKIYKISSDHSWSLDFYNKKPVILSSLSQIEDQRDIWVYINDAELTSLKAYGLDWNKQFTVDQFRITRLQARFMDPSTRKKVLEKMHLIHLY